MQPGVADTREIKESSPLRRGGTSGYLSIRWHSGKEPACYSPSQRACTMERVDRLGLSDREALHLHNPQGIGCRAWSRAQLVIEHHASSMDLFAEVVIVDIGD